jgi:hypothetical protein
MNIIGRYTAGNDSYRLGLRCAVEGTGAYVYWQLGGNMALTGQYNRIYPGEVYHFVITGHNGKAPGQWDLYVDGELAEVGGYEGSVPYTAGDTYIGRLEEAGSEGPLDGKIIDIQIYNRPLSPPEVNYLYDVSSRWDAYLSDSAWNPGQTPLVGIGAGLSGLSGISGLSAII